MAETRKRQPLDEKALEAACEAVLAVPDHPGDKQKIRDAVSTYLAALAKPAGGDEIARWKRDSELLSAIQDECWDVRFTNSPNADAGDYTVNIEIVGHFMADPQERVVGENYNEDLRSALEQAMTAEPYPPARPAYAERDEP